MALTWTPRTTNNYTYSSVTFGNNTYVAVSYGSSGTCVMRSSDGGNIWTYTTPAQYNTWTSVTYGNALFVAVSSNGNNRVMTSPDGITWTSRLCPSRSWYSVAYGNGLFVAVNNNPNEVGVMTSSDGITWIDRNAIPNKTWFGITYGNGLFVAVGAGAMMTSPNGFTWTSRSCPNRNWYSTTYGNGFFVTVGNNGVLRSSNGFIWTTQTSIANNQWRCVTYGNGLFVATATYVTGTNTSVMTSLDGITWTISVSGALNNNWPSVTFGNDKFVAVSLTGGTTHAMTANYSSIRSVTINNITYEYEFQNYNSGAVSSSNSEISGAVSILSSFEDLGAIYNVLSIKQNAFQNRTGITSMTIPDSIISIGDNAFQGCSGITELAFNDVSNEIVVNANTFDGVTSLTSVSYKCANLSTAISSSLRNYTYSGNPFIYYTILFIIYKRLQSDTDAVVHGYEQGTPFNEYYAVNPLTILFEI